MSAFPPPLSEPIAEEDGKLSRAWSAFETQTYRATRSRYGAGTTVERPTVGLYVGGDYFDTTLGKPVWLKTVGPPQVWVTADGVAA